MAKFWPYWQDLFISILSQNQKTIVGKKWEAATALKLLGALVIALARSTSSFSESNRNITIKHYYFSEEPKVYFTKIDKIF